MKGADGGWKPPSGWKQALRAFSVLSGVGIYLCVFIGVFLFAGSEIDDFLGTGNKAKLVCLLLSFPAAFYSIYRQIKTTGIL